MKKSLVPESLHVALFAIIVLLLYIVALVYPDNWWGLHYPAFLGGKGWFIVLVAIGLTLYGSKYTFWDGLSGKNIGGNRWFWTIILTIVAGTFFHQMPIFLDVYGDALTIVPDPEFIVEEYPDYNYGLIFSFDFTNLKLGSDTILATVVWISYVKQVELQVVFQWVGTWCGMGYVFFMLATVFRIARDSQQRFLFALMVLGSPVLLLFCGHIEIYAPIMFFQAVFFYALVRYVEKPSWISGIILLFLCFLNLKFHISGALTFLIFGIAVLVLWLNRKGKRINWKNFGATFLGGFFTIGFCVYAFVTKSIFGTRSYTEENLTDAIFLPIKAAEPAPLNRYNLFSWNHLFDYFNMTFLWSAIAIIIVLVALFFRRNKINWNAPVVLISGLGFIIFFVVFFVLNPLLGMPVDWDLMSIPAISLIVFSTTIVAESKHEKQERHFASYLIAPAISLFLIGSTGIFVNAKQESEASRIIAVGNYSYRTYWIGSITLFRKGLELKENEERFEILDQALRELEPHSVKGNDLQYAAYVNLMGKYYQFVELDTLKAYQFYLKSESYDKTLLPNMFNLSRTSLALEDYATAKRLAENLVFNRYPNEAEALAFAVKVSKESEDKDELRKYSDQLLEVNSDDVATIFDLTVDHFVRKEFKEAQKLVTALVKHNYPNEKKALRMAIHISLEAEDYEASKQYCIQLLEVEPNDQFIQKILNLLNTSKDKSSIKYNFRQS